MLKSVCVCIVKSTIFQYVAIGLFLITGSVSGAEGESENASPVASRKSSVEIKNSIRKGVEFLLSNQNKDGSWGSARRTKGLNIYAPVPGAHHAFKAAVTSLSLSALIKVGGPQEKTVEAIKKGSAWLLKKLPKLRRATPEALYNVWGHAYGLQALADIKAWGGLDIESKKLLIPVMERQVDLLRRYELLSGGWAYYDFGFSTRKPTGDSSSFTTGTVLLSLKDAEGAGVKIPKRIISRAMKSIVRQRKPDFSYLYGEYLKWWPMYRINRPAGSLGRSQVCNAALNVWGDKAVSEKVLLEWLDRFQKRNNWLDIGRKRPIPHESWFAIAGYFYYYGHFYASRCVMLLPKEKRVRFQIGLAKILIQRQEKNGSWWDYPFYNYHPFYGTAFSLIALGDYQKAVMD